jgi:signal peptidase II
MKKKIIELLIMVFIAAALDQLVKALVVHRLQLFESVSVLGDTIRLTLVYNQNGAFSLAPQRLLPLLSTRAFFLVFSLIAASIVLWLYLKTDTTEKWSRFALMLILGGAAGNFIDRVRLGRVIDFIDCDFPDFIMERWPVFNVADSCVTVGITILIVVSLFARKHGRGSEPPIG